jgi:hypothetical protein
MSENKQLESINIEKIRSVVGSKREIYNLLIYEGRYYLPPKDRLDLYFIRDIISGKKKVINS